MAASLENLCHYQNEGKSIMKSIVMGDETWCDKFTLELKKKLGNIFIHTINKLHDLVLKCTILTATAAGRRILVPTFADGS
jgi:hypothetical protein